MRLSDPLDRVRPTAKALDAVDVAATFLFALEGAMAGVRADNVDLLGVLVILGWRVVETIPEVVLLSFDAAALALFAVTGAAKALEHRMSWIVVIMLGTITGVGGGVVRDVLLNRVPLVLSADVYASAAVAGIGVMLITRRLGLPLAPALWLGFLVTVLLRLCAMAFGWALPLPG